MGKRVLFFIFIVGVVLFFIYPPVTTLGGSSIQTSKVSSVSTMNFSLQKNMTSFSDFYEYLVVDNTITTRAIILNGTTATMIELPTDSIAVQLPDNRIAVRYSNEETSILPSGSNMSLYEDMPVVVLPEQRDVLAVSKVVVSPVEGFVTTANFTQAVEALDTYTVTVMFPVLASQNSDAALVQYSIDWGEDGTESTYGADNVSATHSYQKSGTYTIKVNATDIFGFTYEMMKPYTVTYEGDLMHSYFWVQKNKEPVAVTTSTGISMLALSIIAFTETGKYKLLLFLMLFMPLYTRIQKEDVLDQFVRGQIYGYIKTNPGVHYNKIRRQVGVKNGTLSYHLGVLEKTELIQSRREGLKYRAFYPSGMKFPQAERFRLTELQIKMIEAIQKYPGVTQKELARLIDQKPQTVNYNVRVLDQAGLIEMVKDGRKTQCYPNPESPPDTSFV